MESCLCRMKKVVFTRLSLSINKSSVSNSGNDCCYYGYLHFYFSLEETDTLILLLNDWDQVDVDFIKLCEYLFGQKCY